MGRLERETQATLQQAYLTSVHWSSQVSVSVQYSLRNWTANLAWPGQTLQKQIWFRKPQQRPGARVTTTLPNTALWDFRALCPLTKRSTGVGVG